ncbi:Orexin receptor type [Trichinella spiralis]|uniref:MARVEL domain-containing protein n=2 Tax=Trichinella spiralis TaxID=6334 RepID=A0A0V1AT54_TRISP|nr:hypothetical protein T01_14512 [Trichinella spiralis]KRY27892.1 hypothetical protein T01_2615 [Trichinella spiralis]
MEFNRPPLPVTIIPASAIRADKTLLRKVGLNRNLLQPYPAYAFYTLPSAHPKRQQFSSLPSEHAASLNLAAHTLPTSHIRLNTVSGPYKYPEPLYKKTTTLGHFNNRYIATATRPSHVYSTHGKYSKPTTYHAWLRYALKVIQLALAAAVLACVIIPANNEPLQSFFARTKSLGQLFVIAVTIISLVITSIFAVTVFMAKTSFTWRNVDRISSVVLTILYIAATGMEIWYAACYPPFGKHFPDYCHSSVWMIAAILAFLNLVIHATDLMLSLRDGVSLP